MVWFNRICIVTENEHFKPLVMALCEIGNCVVRNRTSGRLSFIYVQD